ncbi:MAG TPA: hypothetical protein VNA20_18060 [Frankiaceae bacterium]|nr:hypothetical protein [Frankiaceae bacterium]
MTPQRLLARVAAVSALAVVPVVAATAPASANEYDVGCLIYPGILVGEETWTKGCPYDVSVKCEPACDELQALVKPLTYYAYDTKDYLLAKTCETEPRLCE